MVRILIGRGILGGNVGVGSDASIDINPLIVGVHAVTIEMPDGAALDGVSASLNGTALDVDGVGLNYECVTTAAGDLIVTIDWTDAQGYARRSRAMRRIVEMALLAPDEWLAREATDDADTRKTVVETVPMAMIPGKTLFAYRGPSLLAAGDYSGFVVMAYDVDRYTWKSAGQAGEAQTTYARIAIADDASKTNIRLFAADDDVKSFVASGRPLAPAFSYTPDGSGAVQIVLGTINWVRRVGTTGEYRVGTGSWTTFPVDTPPRITGLTDGVPTDVSIRLINANGTGAATTISVTSEAEAPEPVEPEFYPAVAPVDMTASAGSLKLPHNNWGNTAGRAGLTANKAMLNQSRSNFTRPGAGTAWSCAIVCHLPVEHRIGGNYYGLFGSSATGNNISFSVGQPSASVVSVDYRRRFRVIRSGVATFATPIWDEDGALVTLWHDGVDQWGADWYSLITGTRFASAPVTNATAAALAGSTGMGIGKLDGLTSFTTDTNGSTPLWPGEIGEIWNIVGHHITPEEWSQVALGASPRDFAPDSAFNYVRQLDGTDASLAKPAWATADTTPASTKPTDTSPSAGGMTYATGSTLRRQSLASYVTLDERADGHVYGLMAGERKVAVPFSGKSSGPVEVRVYDKVDGKVVVDWTAMPASAGGAWSGSIILPESERGYLNADVRLVSDPSVIYHGRKSFGVGYKFMIPGQSQMQIPLDLTTQRLTIAPEAINSAVAVKLVKYANRPAANARQPLSGMIGTASEFAGDGMVAFINQFRKLKPKTPFMIYHEAVGGTSFAGILGTGTDSATDRSWLDLQDKLDRWGNDITAVLFNWLISESGDPLDDLEDGFLPDHVGDRAHSFVTALKPGWKFVSMPSDRRTDTYQRSVRRMVRTKFVYDHQDLGFIIGPNVSDYRIEDAGGGHPATGYTSGSISYAPPETFDHGGARMMQRTAVGALQAVGLIPQHAVLPYYTNARFNEDRSKILVDVIAVNGGRIYSPNPTALRSWQVYEPGDSGAEPFSQSSQPGIDTTTKGYSCVLNTSVSPPRVEITRSSGSFAAGTYVYRVDDSEKRPSGSANGYMEDIVHAGGIYESWWADPLGFGFPVVGTMEADGRWSNRMELLVQPAVVVATGGLTAAINAAVGGETFALAEGAHGNLSLSDKRFTTPIKITGPGKLSAVTMTGCSGINFTELELTSLVISGDGYRNNNIVTHKLTATYVHNIKTDYVRHTHFTITPPSNQLGMLFRHSYRGMACNGLITGWSQDASRFSGGSNDCVYEGVEYRNHSPVSEAVHCDHLQILGYEGGNPSNLWIRHCIFGGVDFDERPTIILNQNWLTQGVIATDSAVPGLGWVDIRIEENLFMLDGSQTISGGGLQGDSRVVRNTVLPAYQGDDASRRARIAIGSGSVGALCESNLTPLVTNAGGETNIIRDNVQYGLASPFPAQSDNPICAIPTVGSNIPDKIGATAWIKDRFVS